MCNYAQIAVRLVVPLLASWPAWGMQPPAGLASGFTSNHKVVEEPHKVWKTKIVGGENHGRAVWLDNHRVVINGKIAGGPPDTGVVLYDLDTEKSSVALRGFGLYCAPDYKDRIIVTEHTHQKGAPHFYAKPQPDGTLQVAGPVEDEANHWCGWHPSYKSLPNGTHYLLGPLRGYWVAGEDEKVTWHRTDGTTLEIPPSIGGGYAWFQHMGAYRAARTESSLENPAFFWLKPDGTTTPIGDIAWVKRLGFRTSNGIPTPAGDLINHTNLYPADKYGLYLVKPEGPMRHIWGGYDDTLGIGNDGVSISPDGCKAVLFPGKRHDTLWNMLVHGREPDHLRTAEALIINLCHVEASTGH